MTIVGSFQEKRRLKSERIKLFVLFKCQIIVNKVFKTTLKAEIQLFNPSIR